MSPLALAYVQTLNTVRWLVWVVLFAVLAIHVCEMSATGNLWYGPVWP